ncbi:Gp138 family membrane-puncturing spike protein [Pseudomonas sp. 10C3]|uniref:Gp138 family membrane-puncturing spike protein n=1 Tax=Pseudomonas sp. 10C3 TaxID=3118753 RepID=UPI002E815CA6|nr:Gp138 family membrane-puncturing spike protein [Pseudomonas sp. 10C3]MEE3504827.1 Gp138 family membrane-puncturing spike protein [Pseudomonas sp. 10C3]
MNILERIEDPLSVLKVSLSGWQSKIQTSMPGIIQSFNDKAMTVTVQPAIQGTVRDEQGNISITNYPLLLDCPVQFPSGGGCTLTFPVAVGDECLVVFASRCIDSWWQSGGIQTQAELRMHDLSDGFAQLGYRSQPHVISGISLSAAQLRTDDGAAFIEVSSATHVINITTTAPINVTSTSSANVIAPVINLAASGQALLKFVTSTFLALFNSHTHASSGSGVPNTPMTDVHMTTTVKGG